MQLILGAAQFGSAYGITNYTGNKPNDSELAAILDYAADNAIDTIDTAEGYGDANYRLKNFHANTQRRFKIINKILRFAVKNHNELTALKEMLLRDLVEFKIKCFDSILLHYAPSVNEFINIDFIEWLKINKIANKVGLSINNKAEYMLVKHKFPVEVIQLPLNILNQCVITPDFIKQLKSDGCEIHARSVFLQGLLLAGSHKLPPFLTALQPNLRQIEILASKLDLPLKALCLAFVISDIQIDKIVVGVQNKLELIDLLENYKLAKQFVHRNTNVDWYTYTCHDTNLIDPSQWAKLEETYEPSR